MKFVLKLGDVFTIPLTENENGFGQCVTPYKKTSGGFIIAVYPVKLVKTSKVNIDEIVSNEPLFLGHTFDAKLFHKDWEIVGNFTSNIDGIILPFYKLGTPPDEIYLTDHNSKKLTEISESTFNLLSYKTEIGPIRYENALKAHFGLKDWIEDDYDMILYKHALDSNKIANKILF